MKTSRLFINGTDSNINVFHAESFSDRFFGLMLKETTEYALFLPDCNCIHTLFMRFPLSIIYIDKDHTVIQILQNLKPWRIPLPNLKAKHILEIPSAFNLQAHPGSTITLK